MHGGQGGGGVPECGHGVRVPGHRGAEAAFGAVEVAVGGAARGLEVVHKADDALGCLLRLDRGVGGGAMGSQGPADPARHASKEAGSR